MTTTTPVQPPPAAKPSTPAASQDAWPAWQCVAAPDPQEECAAREAKGSTHDARCYASPKSQSQGIGRGRESGPWSGTLRSQALLPDSSGAERAQHQLPKDGSWHHPELVRAWPGELHRIRFADLASSVLSLGGIKADVGIGIVNDAKALTEFCLRRIIDPQQELAEDVEKCMFDCQALNEDLVRVDGWSQWATTHIRELLRIEGEEVAGSFSELIAAARGPRVDLCRTLESWDLLVSEQRTQATSVQADSFRLARATLEVTHFKRVECKTPGVARKGTQLLEASMPMPWRIGMCPLSHMRLAIDHGWWHCAVARAGEQQSPVLLPAPKHEVWVLVKSFQGPVCLRDGQELLCGSTRLRCRIVGGLMQISGSAGQVLLQSDGNNFDIGRGEQAKPTSKMPRSLQLSPPLSPKRLALDDRLCESRHAVVNIGQGSWWLEDLSENGTWLRLEAERQYALVSGMRLRVGDYLLAYREAKSEPLCSSLG
eukprot:CAMPEP_0179098578 /NCGR_PEP_ID=MMETSP0796-20121207/45436_1 /TAXON_ID=73915 /ORGANISM="Pyrodinium bahamense, Strain pbaha01" /LENGTH=484 /DNA_ID=CAMNT_0020796361 /DNA_START=308 /DNA_END=1762 /DNA_ORIENTATION=+